MNDYLFDKRLLDRDLLIKLFGTDNVITILEHMGNMNERVNVDTLYKNKTDDTRNYDSSKPIIYHGVEELYRDVLENIFIYLSEYQDTLNPNEQKLYNSYYKYFLQSSKISARFVNTKIQEVCDKVFINTERNIRTIDNSLSKLRDKGEKIYDNLEQYGDAFISFLMEYLTSRIKDADEYTNKMQESIASKLLKDAYKNNVYAQKFLINYTMHKYCIENKIPEISVYIMDNSEFLENSKFNYIAVDLNIIKRGTTRDLIMELYNKLEKYRDYCNGNYLSPRTEIDPFIK